MRYLLLGLVCLSLVSGTALAWDGFDAESADLVELIPDEVPAIGDTVTVKNHDTGAADECLIMSVKRNSRTIEVVVRYGDGRERLFVMEGR